MPCYGRVQVWRRFLPVVGVLQRIDSSPSSRHTKHCSLENRGDGPCGPPLYLYSKTMDIIFADRDQGQSWQVLLLHQLLLLEVQIRHPIDSFRSAKLKYFTRQLTSERVNNQQSTKDGYNSERTLVVVCDASSAKHFCPLLTDIFWSCGKNLRIHQDIPVEWIHSSSG